MAAGAAQLAKRAFVKVLLALAAAYDIAVTVNRDSSDDLLLKAYRRVVLWVHTDKGGTKEETQQLQRAREEWETARKDAQKNQSKIWPFARETTAKLHSPATIVFDFRGVAAKSHRNGNLFAHPFSP